VARVRKFVNQDLTRRPILGNIFFSNRVIDRWNSLDQDTVDAPSLSCFKNRLNKIRWVSSWTSPLNPISLVMWVDLKIRPHKVSTYFISREQNNNKHKKYFHM